MSCYNYEVLTDSNFIFDNIDATYILTMENSERITNVKKQLTSHFLTKTTFIQYNKGFKNNNKTLPPNRAVDISYLDLSHAYLQAFKHAVERNFQSIIILEDDFIFSEHINNRTYVNAITQFLPTIQRNGGLIQLGTLPCVSIKHDAFFRKSFISTGTHANIYSRKYIERTINDADKITDFDCYTNSHGNINRFYFYKPLIYQRIEPTENRANWGKQLGMLSNAMTTAYSSVIIGLTGVDKHIEPGTSMIYKHQIFMWDFITPITIAVLLGYGFHVNAKRVYM